MGENNKRSRHNPFSTHEIHPNSIEAFRDLDLGLRQQIVFDVYVRAAKTMTDRQILGWLTGDYGGDLNKVRPRITEMVQDDEIPIMEVGKTKCKITGKRVRVCMYQMPRDGEQKEIPFGNHR